MPWTERIRKSKYTSPSGIETNFDFESFTNTPAKKTTAFTFGNVAGAFVQDFGLGARTFTIRAFVSGGDYDLLAEQFLRSLEESGAGRWVNPLEGDKTVVPVSASRNDNLVNSANQAVFSITFIETLTSLFPTPTADEKAQVRSLISVFDTAAAESFGETINFADANDEATFKVDFDNVLNTADQILSRDMTSSVKRDFQSSINGIKNGLSALVDDPQELARQTIAALRLASSETDIVDFITTQLQTTKISLGNVSINQKTIRSLNAFSSVATLANSTIDKSFSNRSEAITAAVSLQGQFTRVVNWNDTERVSINQVAANSSYRPFFEASQRESGRLVSDTFDLPLEQFIITSKDRSVVDLASDIYGSGDLDFVNRIINDNDLAGNELIKVPAQKTIRFSR